MSNINSLFQESICRRLFAAVAVLFCMSGCGGGGNSDNPIILGTYPPTPADVAAVTIVSESSYRDDRALVGNTAANGFHVLEGTDPRLSSISAQATFGNPEVRPRDPDNPNTGKIAVILTANPAVMYEPANRNTCRLTITGFTCKYWVDGVLCDVVAYEMTVKITQSNDDGSLEGHVTKIYTINSNGVRSTVRDLGYDTMHVVIHIAE